MVQPPGRGVGTYRALCLAGPLVAVEALGRSFELGTLLLLTCFYIQVLRSVLT